MPKKKGRLLSSRLRSNCNSHILESFLESSGIVSGRTQNVPSYRLNVLSAGIISATGNQRVAGVECYFVRGHD